MLLLFQAKIIEWSHLNDLNLAFFYLAVNKLEKEMIQNIILW